MLNVIVDSMIDEFKPIGFSYATNVFYRVLNFGNVSADRPWMLTISVRDLELHLSVVYYYKHDQYVFDVLSQTSIDELFDVCRKHGL